MLKFLSLAFAGSLLTGCGGYIYTEVYDEPAPYDVVYTTYDTSNPYSRVGHIELTWDACNDLDLELLTPNYHLIVADGDDLDGCSHMGDDYAVGGHGFEEIICVDPPWGGYEVHVTNLSDRTMTAHVRTIYEVGDGYYADVWDETRDVTIPAGDTALVPVQFE